MVTHTVNNNRGGASRPYVFIGAGNTKTGKMVVSTTEEKSCPAICPHINGACYAKYHWTGYWWKKVRDIGDTWEVFVEKIRRLPSGSKFRHNQAGDLPADEKGKLDSMRCKELATACEKLKAFTFTHHSVTKHNLRIMKNLNRGITVNLSADSELEADMKVLTGLPVVMTCKENAPNMWKTAGGNLAVVCPEQQGKVESCAKCMMCEGSRDYIIAFRAHGVGRRQINGGA